MTYKILVPLLPSGEWARRGAYNKMSSRMLRFDVRLESKLGKRYDTLEDDMIETFSMCGSPTKAHSGDQGIEDIVAKYRSRVPQDKLEDFDRLIEMWRKYHLNDMCTGTDKQSEVLEKEQSKAEQIGVQSYGFTYEVKCKILKSHGLLFDRGYEYGTRWLIKPIPEDDLKFIHRICEEWGSET